MLSSRTLYPRVGEVLRFLSPPPSMLAIPQGVPVVGRTRGFHISCGLAVWIQEFAPYSERWKCPLPFVHSVAGENWTGAATLPPRASQTVAHITFPEGLGRSLRQSVRESGAT